MITPAEADQLAAGLVLGVVQALWREPLPGFVKPEDVAITREALKPIEAWLRRRVLGGDKIAIRQIEKEMGHQVRLKGKQR